MGVAPQEDGVGEQGPDVVELGLARLVVDRVAHGVLHPGVGRHDEQPPRASSPPPPARWLARWAFLESRFQPKIQMPRKVDSRKNATRPSMASGPPKTLPTSREYADQFMPNSNSWIRPGHHADGHVDQQQRPEEAGEASVGLVPVAVPRGLEQRHQEGQPDRHGDEEEVVDARHGELPPGEVEVHSVSLPSVMAVLQPAGGGGVRATARHGLVGRSCALPTTGRRSGRPRRGGRCGCPARRPGRRRGRRSRRRAPGR